VIAGIADKL